MNRFRLYSIDELAELPPPRWLIAGVLPEGALAEIIAENGSYKTFLALDWSAHISLGIPWLDRDVGLGPVVYVYAEGRMGIGVRMAAWQAAHPEEATPRILFLPSTLRLNDPTETASLLTAIGERLGPVEDPALIVLDTLNRTFVGNESSTEDMTAYRAACDRLREATGATVLVIHHKGRGEADRGRGSIVLEDSADTVIFCSRDAERLTVECTKQRDATPFEAIVLEAVPTAGSLALKAGGPTTGILSGSRLGILAVLYDESTDASGMSYTAWLAASGISKGTFNKAREWLRANSYVTNDNGRWRLTDGGKSSLSAVRSTRSTAGIPNEGGPNTRLVYSAGGLYKTPAVNHGGVNQGTNRPQPSFVEPEYLDALLKDDRR